MAPVINLFVPGLGHLLLGMPFQGVLWFIFVAIGYAFFIIPGIVLHLICIIDGARAQSRANAKAMEKAVARAMSAKSKN